MIFYVFIGGVISAICAVIIQYFFKSFLETRLISENGFYPVAVFASLEEIFKFILTYIIVRKSKYFDEPVDAMIYMVTAAAGMAAVENVSIMAGSNLLSQKAGILIFRFLGATLLHILSSSLIGYYWAKGIVKKKVLIFIFVGLAAASLLHAAFNYSIIVLEGGIIYSIVFLVIAAFFIFYDFEKLNGLKAKLKAVEAVE